eukprot:12712713-Alexandrium_andersonii.AAC.1
MSTVEPPPGDTSSVGVEGPKSRALCEFAMLQAPRFGTSSFWETPLDRVRSTANSAERSLLCCNRPGG